MTGLDGRRLIGEGAEAEIYEWDDGFVLRLMRSANAGPSLTRATMASEAARASRVATPKVLEIITVDGRPGQIMERVDGSDMMSEIGDKPQRIVAAARNLARIQTQLHAVSAPPDLETLHDYLAHRITTSTQLTADVGDRALATLAELPEGNAVCHGDFHPGNVLLTGDGPVLIDWSSAARGDATADFARTRLLIQVGALPEGASRLIRTTVRVGRRVLLRLYVDAYRKQRPVDMMLADRWMEVCAAVRLTEIEGSTPEGRAALRIARRSAEG